MELAVVSHDPDAGPPDTRQVAAVARRLAQHPLTAVCGRTNSADLVAHLARTLGVEMAIMHQIDLDRMIADHPGERVVVVCDSGTIRDLVAQILDVPNAVVPEPDTGSLTCIRASRSGIRSVVCVNDTVHIGKVLPGCGADDVAGEALSARQQGC